MTQLALLRWLGSCAALLLVTIAAVHTQTTSDAPRLTVATDRMIQDVTLGRLESRPVTRTRRVDDGMLLNLESDPSLATAASDVERKYFITDIGTLGGKHSFAYGINDVGQVFGYSWITGDGPGHPFLYQNGTMADLGELVVTPAGGAINNSGQIATGITIDGIVRSAIYDSQTGVLTIIPSLGGVSSFGFSGVVTAINNRSKAVGWGYIDSLTPHALLHRNGGAGCHRPRASRLRASAGDGRD